MLPETQVIIDATKEIASKTENLFSELYSNFDGKINMIVKLTNDKEAQYNDRFLSKEMFDVKMEKVLSKLDDIHTQTKKTNGRVTEIEKWKGSIAGRIKDIIEEKKEMRRDINSKMRSLVFELIKILIINGLSIGGMLLVYTKFLQK